MNRLEQLDLCEMGIKPYISVKPYLEIKHPSGWSDYALDNVIVNYQVAKIKRLILKYGKVRIEVVHGHETRQRIIKKDGHSRYRNKWISARNTHGKWSDYHGSCYMERGYKFDGCPIEKVIKSMIDHDMGGFDIVEIRAGLFFWKNVTNE